MLLCFCMCFLIATIYEQLLYMRSLVITLDSSSCLQICLQLLWASNYDCCIFPFRYFNLLLGDWSNFWCVIFILWSSYLTKLMHLFICQNVFLIFLGFYFLLKIIYSTEKKEWYNWGIVLRLKPKTPSPFCSCCLLCWAMTALAERHGFSTNTSQILPALHSLSEYIYLEQKCG